MEKLKALFTRLSWQLEDIQKQIHSIQTQLSHYQDQIRLLEKTLENQGEMDLHIHPEKEMSRLSFTLKTRAECDQIHNHCRTEETELTRLLDKQLRVKTELRLLEKFQTQQTEQAKQQTVKKEQDMLDEWTLQKRKNA